MGAPQQPPFRIQAQGPLAAALVTLAGTPNDLPTIDEQLTMVAQLAADRITGVDYASITAVRDNGYVTVAASSELALAVDLAQYADDDGPCLQSLRDEAPVTVKDIPATMSWPGFRKAAATMGLRASASVPLAAGSGSIIAVLNLYGRDPGAMAPLLAGLAVIYDPSRVLPYQVSPSAAAGVGEFLAGCAEALSVHATIQRALGVLMAQTHAGPADAYAALRIKAATAGISLPAAAGLITQPVAEHE